MSSFCKTKGIEEVYRTLFGGNLNKKERLLWCRFVRYWGPSLSRSLGRRRTTACCSPCPSSATPLSFNISRKNLTNELRSLFSLHSSSPFRSKNIEFEEKAHWKMKHFFCHRRFTDVNLLHYPITTIDQTIKCFLNQALLRPNCVI